MLSPLARTYRWLSSAQVLKKCSFKKEKENDVWSDFMIIQTNGADFILPFREELTSPACRQRKGKWGSPVAHQSKACHLCAGKVRIWEHTRCETGTVLEGGVGRKEVGKGEREEGRRGGSREGREEGGEEGKKRKERKTW